jgi:O-succinylbenzoic acid--CoA ligase
MYTIDTENCVNINPDSLAIISKYNLNYAEYFRHIKQTVDHLSKNSFQQGENVALLIENDLYFTITLFALIQIGSIVVPLNKKLPENQMIKMLKCIGCLKIITDKDFHSDIINSKFQTFLINKFVQKDISTTVSSKIIPTPLNQDCSIIFTSGSSGNPKAVLHTFGNHYYSAKGSNKNIQFKPGDRWLLSLPLYHIAGLSILFRAFISAGTIVLPDKNLGIVENIKRNKVTHISLVVTQLLQLIDNKASIEILKNLKAILIGGSYIPSELIDKSIENKLPLCTTYGSTEMASQITTTKVNEKPEKLYTSGRLLKYREVKIAEDKEILIKGKTLFKGYIENNKIVKPVNLNGWFHSGDIGEIDSEGYLSILGRKDNLFISGGENIYPEEIEKLLLNIDGISKALVIDIPDKKFGARPVAFIEIKDYKLVFKVKILKYLSKHLPKYKFPDVFYLWPKKHISFKPNRTEFKDYYNNSKLEEIE